MSVDAFERGGFGQKRPRRQPADQALTGSMADAIQQARRLRRVATAPEKRLWSRLRNRQLAGLKFRRQEPICGRVVDFFCAEARLAIELDGSGHSRHFTQARIWIAKSISMKRGFD